MQTKTRRDNGIFLFFIPWWHVAMFSRLFTNEISDEGINPYRQADLLPPQDVALIISDTEVMFSPLSIAVCLFVFSFRQKMRNWNFPQKLVDVT